VCKKLEGADRIAEQEWPIVKLSLQDEEVQKQSASQDASGDSGKPSKISNII
jgi:hypothetical protein